MSLDTAIITGAMTGQITLDEADNLLTIHMAVTHQMFCPVSGRVLDSRTAAMWEIEDEFGSPLGASVFDPSVTSDQLRAIVPEGATLGSRFDPGPAWEKLGITA